MRIIMLSWEYPPNIIGGISRHVEELAEALSARGHEVHVITYQAGDAPDEETINGVFVHRVRADGDRADFLPWVKSLNRYTALAADEILASAGVSGKGFPETTGSGGEADTIIHGHDWLAEDAAIALKRKHKLPMIVTVHATEYGRNYGIHSDIQRHITHLEWELTYEAWRVIVCSEFMKGEVNTALSVPIDKMDVVPNGVDAAKFDFDFPDRKDFRGNYATDAEKIIIHAGRNVREKGAQVLIEAFKKVLHEQPGCKLVIVGGGDRTWLKDQAEALGIGDRVYFTGFVDDETLLKLYRVSDIAAFPSLYEPFGIVALEAMAARVPVIVSDVGGLVEVVDHDVTGIQTWANNSDSLAWGILEVFKKSHATLKNMVDAAYEKATTVFSWTTIAGQTESVYNRVMGEYKEAKW